MSIGIRAGLGAFGLIFFGVAIGVGIDHVWVAHQVHGPASHEMSHHEALQAMLGSLDLTDEQSHTIDAIYEHANATIQQQLAAVHPVLQSTMDSARREMEALLDSNQLVAFRAWIRQEHERLDSVEGTVILQSRH
jgi:Spy/CpxP family protein refolding chaperone